MTRLARHQSEPPRTRLVFAAAVFCLLPFSTARVADAHCEVPCGIYADQMRFDQMLEDTGTMKKAMGKIGELTGKTDAPSLNQAVRWATRRSRTRRTRSTSSRSTS